MRYHLSLYVTGSSRHSQRAIHNLKSLCEHKLEGRYDMEVIDISDNPACAERDKIMATPMLVRRQPEPVRKIIGDLSDTDRVLRGLEILPAMGGAGDWGKA